MLAAVILRADWTVVQRLNLAPHKWGDYSKETLYVECCLRVFEIYFYLHMSNFFSFAYSGSPYRSDVAHTWNPSQPIHPMISHRLCAYIDHRPSLLRLILTYGNPNMPIIPQTPNHRVQSKKQGILKSTGPIITVWWFGRCLCFHLLLIVIPTDRYCSEG